MKIQYYIKLNYHESIKYHEFEPTYIHLKLVENHYKKLHKIILQKHIDFIV